MSASPPIRPNGTPRDVAALNITAMVVEKVQALPPVAIATMIAHARAYGQPYESASRRISRIAQAVRFSRNPKDAPYENLYMLKVLTRTKMLNNGMPLSDEDQRLFDLVTYGVTNTFMCKSLEDKFDILPHEYALVLRPWLTAVNAPVSGKDTAPNAVGKHVTTLSNVRQSISRMSVDDVERLVCSGVTWEEQNSRSFMNAINLLDTLPETEKRAMTAAFTISRITVTNVMERVSKELFMSVGDYGVNAARGILMGVCVAAQAKPYALRSASEGSFSKSDYALLMEPWLLAGNAPLTTFAAL